MLLHPRNEGFDGQVPDEHSHPVYVVGAENMHLKIKPIPRKNLRSLATDAGVAWVSLGRGAEWPGERDSGPELASGWAGSWEDHNLFLLPKLVFCLLFVATNLSLYLSYFFLLGVLGWPG